MASVLSHFKKDKSIPLFGKKKFDDKITKLYKLSDVLGSGGFSVVYLGESLKTYKQFAVKCINKKKLAGIAAENLINEISILQKLNHPNIIGLEELIDNKANVYIVMELVLGGELFDRIVERGSYTESDAADLVKQVLQALQYLHSNQIVHRDIKPENLLYYSREEDSKIMLTDFGLAKIEDNEVQTTACGTPGYVAPEVLQLKAYGKPVDCWALGVVTYILLCGYPPFFDDDDQRLYKQIMEGIYEYDSPYWDDISEDGKEFVSGLMTLEPDLRTTCKQALNHRWLAGGLGMKKNIHQSVSTQLKKHFNAKSKWKQAIHATTAAIRMQNLSLS